MNIELEQRESDRNDERRHIARELHDELGQVLTALKLGISTFRMAFGREHQAFEAKVTGLLELTNQAIRTVRTVTSSLRPTALDMGIVQALQWLVGEFEHHSGASCHLKLSTSLDEVDDLRAMTVFLILSERKCASFEQSCGRRWGFP
ncbi:sensor histidine kinase [Nitrincola sp. MINF-07-Sa-05]|uniref:sensor histidine kinase n=1 Tax=Nitrincola salilacus TaxID=3400273 RepID=UPI00391840FD